MSESGDSDILADIKALDDALALNTVDNEPTQSRFGSSPDLSDNDDDYIVSNQDISETQDAYDINKKLLKGLTIVKNKLSNLMVKCERKIDRLNEEIRTRTEESKKRSRFVLITAGMPYFKDNKGCFNAPKNADTKLKEARGELCLLNLSKASRWSAKDRKILLKAVYNEAIESIHIFNLDISNKKANSSNNQTQDLDEEIDVDSIECVDRSININQTANFGKEISAVCGKGKATSEQTDSSHKYPTVKISVLPKNFSEMVGAASEREFDWFKIAATDFENRHSPGECRAMWRVYLHPDIEKKEWTNAEDKKLLQYAKEYKYQDWEAITKKLGTKRSAYQCFIRHNTIKKTPSTGRFWSKAEDKQLKLAINTLKIGNYIPWAEVASYLQGRTKQQVYTRWVYRKAPHLTKGRFTYTETYTLLKAINEYGKNFCKISQTLMPHRTSVQLQSHYQTIMETKKNVWTLSDDTKLIRLHKEYGNDWVSIAKHFTSITRTQVRHRYKALVKYINQGYSITNVPRSSNQAILSNKRNTGVSHNSSKCKSVSHRKRVSDGDVLSRLFETLSFPPSIKENDSQAIDADQLAYDTRNLYNTLALLGANIDFPDEFIDYMHLSKRERQLLISLKAYRSASNSNVNNELIEKYRYKMFGPLPKMSGSSHFIPPLPFNGYIKPKKSNANSSLDCHLNLNEKYLIEKPTEIKTPCEVSSYIDETTEEVLFGKLAKLLINDNYYSHKQGVSSCATSNDANTVLKRKANKNPVEKSGRCEFETEKTYLCETGIEYVNEEPYASSKIILPSHATLLGLKNLLLWKLLYEHQNRFCPTSNNAQQSEESKSPEYKRAYQNLKKRLLRLFKFPIGLSSIIIEMPSADSVFLTEDHVRKKAPAGKTPKSKKRKIIEIDSDFQQKINVKTVKRPKRQSRETISKKREKIIQNVNSVK